MLLLPALYLLAVAAAQAPTPTTPPLAAGTASVPPAFPPIPLPPGPVAVPPLLPAPHPPLGVFWPVAQPPLPALTASAPSFAVTLCAGKGRGRRAGYGYDGDGGDDGDDGAYGDNGDDHDHDRGHAHAHAHAHGHHHGGHHHGGHHHHTPTTRTYNLTITYAAGDPDGFARRLTTFNGLFPGPTIEALQGDTIEVTVHNGIDTPQAIHWHGMEQRHTNYMDGVPGFTQCPIPPGGAFTYRFVASAAGTYFYHSHYGNTMSDGLFGALVVHSPHEERYDADYVLFASDWNDDQSALILDAISDVRKGYRGLPVVAMPDAITVNGVGQVDCATVQAGVECRHKEPYELRLPAGAGVRLRIINPGGHAMVRVSIDGHELEVVEADGTALVPFKTKEVPVNNGQRYSVVVELDREPDTAAYIRVNAATNCQNPLVKFTGLGVLRYTVDGVPATAVPEHDPWPDLADPQTTPCADFDDALLVPALAEDAPADTCAAAQLDSHSGVFLEPVSNTPFLALAFNNTPYINYINSPFFSELKDGRELNASNVPSVTFNSDGTADLIINLLDPQPLAHPFHLHGRPFYIVARGNGTITTADIPNLTLNLANPIRRDSLTITPGTWVILRLKLDDPGVWALHCHIGWHLAVGKMAAVVVRPRELGSQVPPAEWDALCAGTDVGEIGPRGLFNERVPPQARRSLEFDTRAAAGDWRLRSERIKRWFQHVAPPQNEHAARQAQWERWVSEALVAAHPEA